VPEQSVPERSPGFDTQSPISLPPPPVAQVPPPPVSLTLPSQPGSASQAGFTPPGYVPDYGQTGYPPGAGSTPPAGYLQPHGPQAQGAPPHGPQPYGPQPANPGANNRPSIDPASLVAGAKRFSGSSMLMLITAAVSHVLGLVVPSDSKFPFFDLGLWALFGVVCVALLGAPLVAGALKLSPVQAWRVAAAGSIGLAFHWLAFVVPILEKNPSFFMTLGLGAALWSTYLAPGRVQALAKPTP
jgi:hypothetical protein